MTPELEYMYKTDKFKESFGDAWCGPEILPHFEEVLIAVYVDSDDDQIDRVRLSCLATPSLFFTIWVLATNDNKEYTLQTGSICEDFAHRLCEEIADDSIGLKEAKK